MSLFVMFMSKEIYSGLKINIHVDTLQLYKTRYIICLNVNELLIEAMKHSSQNDSKFYEIIKY